MPTYAELRASVLDYLRSGQVGSQFNLYDSSPGSTRQFFAQRHAGFNASDGSTVCDILFELENEGIVSPGTGSFSVGDQFMCWPWFRITAYGRSVLAATGYVPYDPDGYLRRFNTEFPGVHPVILKYLEEGIRCMARGYLIAAPVMIGGAAEKAMLILIETFGNAIADQAKKTAYERDVDKVMIKRKYDALWNRLQRAQTALPADLKDDLQTVLDRVFDLIRTVRNEAGHPTGKNVDRDTTHANFILFPVYYRRVWGLISYFQQNAPVF